MSRFGKGDRTLFTRHSNQPGTDYHGAPETGWVFATEPLPQRQPAWVTKLVKHGMKQAPPETSPDTYLNLPALRTCAHAGHTQASGLEHARVSELQTSICFGSGWWKLAMILVYGDDSAGEKKERVCAVGVVIGTEDRWKDLEEKWLERTGGIPFHANECESDRGDYANRPHEANKTLYRDLTTLLVESELSGWGVKRIALPQSGRGRGCPVQTKSRFGSVLHREHWATEPVLHREHSAPERWLVVKF